MGFLKFIALVVALIALCEGSMWVYRRWQLYGLSDFHRWLKDPDYRRAIEEDFAKRRSVTVPDDVSDATIRSWVMALAGIGDEPYARERLRLVGPKATVPLIEALSHPAFLMDLPDDSPSTKNGLDEVFGLLRDIAPSEAVPHLAKFADHHDVRRVKEAALLLGCIADSGGLPALIKALHHDDDYVRSYALMGLEEARLKCRGVTAFWRGIYPNVVPLIDREDSSTNAYAPLLVVSIEPDDGLQLLLTNYCTKANKRLHYTLAAIRTTKGDVPSAVMDRLLADLEPVCTAYPWNYSLAELLRLMAHRRYPQAEELALRYINHAEGVIREGAADALVLLRGMADPVAVVFDIVDAQGFEVLTEPQRTVYVVRRLVDEVNNGGLAQYLGNGSGDHANEAAASLDRIGAKELAGHLRRVLKAAFGSTGPSTIRDKRMGQIAKMTKAQDAEIEGFDQHLYKGPEQIETLMMKYAIQHADDFKVLKK